MSTRSRSRRHPYQRQGQSSRNRGNRRQQNMAASEPAQESGRDLGGCIDLTGNDSVDVGDDDIIDLTILSPNDSVQLIQDPEPIVMITRTDVHNAAGSSAAGTRGRRNNTSITLDDPSDEELPDVPFTVPDTSATDTATSPVKVTCPVCLETDSQIRRTKHLCSTTCGHIFCSACIMQAIEAQNACPTCRRRITKRQVHKIFL
ncbi:hypothetical protein ACOMHN_033517 [Nucella lapillus]